MLGGLVEVTQEGQVLSLERGFLVAKAKGGTKRIPLDQLEALILTARSATLSRTLMTELAARGISVIVSGENYEPQGSVHCIGITDKQFGKIRTFNGKTREDIEKPEQLSFL